MATIKSDMPPLHAAEALKDVESDEGVDSGGGGGPEQGGNISTSAGRIQTTGSISANVMNNNTISAAADSSDNQPGTPQPQATTQVMDNDQRRRSTGSHLNISHQPYASQIFAGTAGSAIATTTTAGTSMHMYPSGIYAIAPNQEEQQQQSHQNSGYPTYLNSYENFYQHAQAPSSIDYGVYNSSVSVDYNKSGGIRYHPYLQTPTSGGLADRNDALSASNASAIPLSNKSSTVSTTAMSPRVVSSTSPTSTSNGIHLTNATSPGCKFQCKKCGIISTNETELQEHISNAHGASPYASSSGYSSSPYIKEETSQTVQGSAVQQQHHHQQQQQIQGNAAGNAGDILDLDSQKMVYPPNMPGDMPPILQHQHEQDSVGTSSTDPLHSMHTMQQRAITSWEQSSTVPVQEGLSPFIQQTPEGLVGKSTNSSNYFAAKISPYNSSNNVKLEYPLIKTEYADSQNYVDKSFDPTVGEICQQVSTQQSQHSQQIIPVSSSPAEFPSTTTGSQDHQQQYRSFEPPTSSSMMPTNNITAKAATWKSNEARRPKTYNCTACNKWFTSSGHLKRHYNTTLHKNAVKSSGQPDPATLPISAHHHPARDPNSKHSRRNSSNTATAAQQQTAVTVQPVDLPKSPTDFSTQGEGLGQMPHFAGPGSPTNPDRGGMSYTQTQQNGYSSSPFLQQAQSAASDSSQHPSSHITGSSQATHNVLNGHPNGLAGPSVPATTLLTSSLTRGLLHKSITIKTEPMEDNCNTQIKQTSMEAQMAHRLEEAAELAHQHLRQLQQQQLETLEQLEAKTEFQQQHLLQQQRFQLEPLELLRQYRNNSIMANTRTQSPLIISQQQFQEQAQQQVVDNIFSRTPPPRHQAIPILQQPTTMDLHQYNIIPLDTNTVQSNNNMQPLQQPQHIITNMATINTDNTPTMLHNHHQQQQQLPPLQESEVTLPPIHNSLSHSNINNQFPLDTINITPPLHSTTTITQQQQLPQLSQQQPHTTTIPSFQQLQQVSRQRTPDHTMTYHTIIGNNNNTNINNISNSDMLQLATFDSYRHIHQQQFLTAPNGQIMQLISTAPVIAQPLYASMPTRTTTSEAYAPISSYSAQGSPQEADLPPAQSLPKGNNATQPKYESPTLVDVPSLPYSPTISSSTRTLVDDYSNSNDKEVNKDYIAFDNDNIDSTNMHSPKPIKRKRKPTSDFKKPLSKKSNTKSTTPSLPSERIECHECKKEFTKICYLTQHNKSFHFGEYPYRCQKCGKRFQVEEIYIIHTDRHKVQDKPHKCEICPKQFHHKTDLRRHVEAIHTGLKQHMCNVCEKTFCRKDHLRKHIETHYKARIVNRKTSNVVQSNSKGISYKDSDTEQKSKQECLSDTSSLYNETNLLGADINSKSHPDSLQESDMGSLNYEYTLP